MLALPRRVHQLEREHAMRAGPHICPECGAGARAKPEFIVTFEEPDPSDTPDLCPRCGRRQVYRIEFDQRG